MKYCVLDFETANLDTITPKVHGVGIRTPDGNIDYYRSFDLLKTLCEDTTILKIAHNIKFEYAICNSLGIHLAYPWFDTKCAAYVLNPSRDNGLKSLVFQEFSHKMLTYKDMLTRTQVDDPTKRKKYRNASNVFECPDDTVAEYCKADVYWTEKLYIKYAHLTKDYIFSQIEMPLIKIIADMELQGINVQQDYLSELKRTLVEEQERLKIRCQQFIPVEVNLNSPIQLRKALFSKLGLESKLKSKKTHSASTGKQALKMILGSHEVVKDLLDYKEVTKLVSSFTDSLISEIHPKTEKIHCDFKQFRTRSYRFACANPNLQQIPKHSDIGNKIRNAFVAPDGWTFVSYDYSQMELRLLAHFSDDATLRNALLHDVDIHRLTASEIFKKKMEDITDYERYVAKSVNFGIIYGETEWGLSKNLQIDKDEARRYIMAYYGKYPGVYRWMLRTKNEAVQNGYVTTLYGHKRLLQEIYSTNNKEKSGAERIALNTPIQGTGADIIKLAMIKISEFLKGTNWIKLVLQIHDDLTFVVQKLHCENGIPLKVQEIKHIMETVAQLKIPLLVDMSIGEKWGEMKKL